MGSAGGGGALLTLLALGKRPKAESIDDAFEYAELAAVPDFEEHCIEAARFATSDPYP